MTCRVGFKDVDGISLSFKSIWKETDSMISRESQTDTSLTKYEFEDAETLCGRYTEAITDEVEEKTSGISVLNHFCTLHKIITREHFFCNICQKM